MWSSSVTTALGLALGVVLTSQAYASSCSDEGLDFISYFAFGTGSFGNSGCSIGSTNNDKVPNTLRVNEDVAFGHSDWTFLQRLDRFGDAVVPRTNSDVFEFNNALTNSGIAGQFSVTDEFFSTYSAYMIVLKGGKDATLPSNYVSYLFTEEDGLDGAIYSPFINTSDGSTRRFSHLSFYGLTTPLDGEGPIGGPNPVPLPASIWVLASGLGMVVATRKLKRDS